MINVTGHNVSYFARAPMISKSLDCYFRKNLTAGKPIQPLKHESIKIWFILRTSKLPRQLVT